MLKVFRWDGREIFINPENILFVEYRDGFGDKDTTDVTMSDGKTYSLSATSFDILTGQTLKKTGPGKAGFDVL